MLDTLKKEIKVLFGPTRLGPSYPSLPEVNDQGETKIKGLYIKGDAAGDPLIKVGLNLGYEFVEDIKDEIKSYQGTHAFDLIIIGSGATGFAAANRAHELGINYLLLEGERFANVIQNFTKGKPLFNEPHSLQQKGSIWFEECSKEELLEKWNEHGQRIGLNMHEFEKVVDIKGEIGDFSVMTEKASYKSAFVLVSIGKAGNPRKANVRGEKEYPEKIYHLLADPDVYHNQNIFIYGGGDVACEAVLALCGDNKVTMVTIDPHFIYPKKRNADAVTEKANQGIINLHFNSRLDSISEKEVSFASQEAEEITKIRNDVVFEMIGAIPPTGFFKKIGVGLANTWNGNHWFALMATLFSFVGLSLWANGIGNDAGSLQIMAGGLSFLFGLGLLFYFGVSGNRWALLGFTILTSYTIYAAKGSTPHFPFHWIGADDIAAYLGSGMLGSIVPTAVIALKGAPSFWYSLLYTVLVVFFGLRAMKRWGTDQNDRYQVNRYITIIAFQIVFFIVVNLILSVLIGKYYWRGWGLYQPFPLFYNTFFWWYPGDPASIKYFFIGFGLFLTFIAIPLFVRRHGMRFCTWVCGCGGLAETLGDTWRHLSPKGEKSRKWEFMGPMILFWAFISLGVIAFAFQSDGNNIAWKAYDYAVDFWMVAVIPIGLYPFFGGKVWCRYWCPLAHYMKLLSNWYGRLQIVSNEKCISCTQCSKYCQVGVDVMAFAKNQQAFDNTNSSCIHCGICITVCPMDVLSFDLKDSNKVAIIPVEQIRIL
ncbi:MAG: NAD(P)-binding domain-containing protein [Saprospiraceae bacterium]|nr:NAD(P)-binding domain-containing protein [Saprospiraceae bacterium]